MDPIADMLTRIRNAQAVKHETILFPHSTLLWNIVKVLERIRFLKKATRKGKKSKRVIELELDYNNTKQPVISKLRRISKPGRRIYKKVKELRPIKNGTGVAIISTPKGLLTDSEARKQNIGGEVLLEIW